ncbi:signal peptidase I [Streptomyces sp. VNUA74]|nr:signal peptidase I [Streptomyces sp. VNUA74]WML80917.1 signal peptidase I [Streptomyces sp. VNUA74]
MTSDNLPYESSLSINDGLRISTGNAEDPLFSPHGGWFVGGFLSNLSGLRRDSSLAVKWGVHKAGEMREEPSSSAIENSLAILISGVFKLQFPGESPTQVILSERGDYVLFGPGVQHVWTALNNSVIVTIRWHVPSSAALEGS